MDLREEPFKVEPLATATSRRLSSASSIFFSANPSPFFSPSSPKSQFSESNRTDIPLEYANTSRMNVRLPLSEVPASQLADDLQMLERVSSSTDDHKAGGSELAPWPARLTSPSPRLADFGYSNEMFGKDTEMWGRIVENYWNLLSPKIQSDTLRNVMDMKANLGSFAAALKDKDVWVMNVVPEDGPNTLKLIYDRGLIGAVHSCLRFCLLFTQVQLYVGFLLRMRAA